MIGKMLLRGLLIGTMSGIILAGFFKFIEIFIHIPLYTLLLAIDFVPFLNRLQGGEAFEFCLHMAISLFIGVVYVWICTIRRSKKYYTISFLLTLPTFFLYFPLTTLSHRTTLTPTAITPALLWIAGHLLFSYCMAFFYKHLH